MRQNTFTKKNLAGKMRIEQIIEFESKRPGPLSRTYTRKPGCFRDQPKISKVNAQVLICSKKYCRRQCALPLLLGPSHLQNLIPEFKILTVFWT